jgi:steroid 5-alpha reductase family enzyme
MTSAQWSLIWVNVWVMLGVVVVTFVVGELTGNVSQVDKLWSIVPFVYCWIAAVRSDLDGRMVLMAALATVWGARLTYNFSRMGGYTWRFWVGHEDYRWAYLRQWPVLRTRPGWTAFNLLFICFYQNVLLLLITLPIATARGAKNGLGAWDALLAVLFLALVALETYSDQTMWRFQNEKKRRRAAGEPLTGRYAAGFIHDGIWAHSRHPNYLAEQSVWIVFFLFSVVATSSISWTVVGAVLLLGLFQGSSRMSEWISVQRYPEYATYQRHVPRFVPRPRATLPEEALVHAGT